ncbi:hypothetical protein STENM223S_05723 [Streptomyces tendae]
MPASRCDTGTSRRAPPGPATISVASRAASTGSASPVGAAEAMLPPRVPALRMCGGPAARAAAASAGMSAAKSGRPMRAWVSPAPSSACPSRYCQPRISLILQGGPARRAGAAGVDGGHQVGAAGDGHGGGHGGEGRHGLVQRRGQRHGLRRLRCVRAQDRLPLPAAPPGPARGAVRYVLTGRTWQLWQILAGAEDGGPRGGIRPPGPGPGRFRPRITVAPRNQGLRKPLFRYDPARSARSERGWQGSSPGAEERRGTSGVRG